MKMLDGPQAIGQTVVAVAATASDGSAVSYSVAAVRVNGTADTDPPDAGDIADSDLSSSFAITGGGNLVYTGSAQMLIWQGLKTASQSPSQRHLVM